jgi:serine/threonine protein kinase
MGRVYLASTPGGRPVALKVIRPEYGDDEDFRRRFRQEIQAARRVHGCIPRRCSMPIRRSGNVLREYDNNGSIVLTRRQPGRQSSPDQIARSRPAQ